MSTGPRERALGGRGGGGLWTLSSHLLIHLLFTEHLLGTRHCSKHGETRRARFLLSWNSDTDNTQGSKCIKKFILKMASARKRVKQGDVFESEWGCC